LVLRITRGESNGSETLKVEGRVADDWVDELTRVVSGALTQRAAVALDLSEVTFVDARGIAALRALRARGAELTGCSSFVSSLIDGGGS
jgi:ABC-type transporter Mla MlaB component